MRASFASRFAVRFIDTYQSQVRADLPAACRFTPSCSEYGRAAYDHYGFFRATAKVVGRLSRCRSSYTGPLHDPA